MFSGIKNIVKKLFRKKTADAPHESHPEAPVQTDTSVSALPVLSEKEDFHTLFGVEKSASDPAADMADTASKPPRPVLKKKKKRKKTRSVKRFNKHGVPVFDSKIEVGELFEEAGQDSSDFKIKNNRVSEVSHPSFRRSKPSSATSPEKTPAGHRK